MDRVRSIPRHQAILADKNAEGLTSSLVPCMQPATIQGWVANGSVRRALGVGMLLDPLSNWQFSMRLEGACLIHLI